MKKVTLLLLLSFVLAITYARADIASVNTAFIYVQIANLNKFTDIEIVSCPADKTVGPGYAKILEKYMYHPYPTTLYVVKKEYLKKVGLLKIDCHKDKHVHKLNLCLDKRYCNTRKFVDIWVDYTLVKRGATYYLYKSRATYINRTKGFNRATKRVKNFKNEVVNPSAPILFSENAL
jgi:hypothetical protein